MGTLQTTTTITGWSLFFIMAGVFVLNFFIARYLTVRLVQNKYIKKKSPELQKAFIFWFCPIVGALGLWMLLWTFHVIKWWKNFKKWLTLSHV